MGTNKRALSIIIFGAFGLLFCGLFWLSTPEVTEAACGASTTSCKTCHEIKGEDPVSKKGDWHSQHAFADFCQACHLGVATENEKEKAHAGIIAAPLTQPEQSCVSCHPSDVAARVAQYGGTVSGGTGGSPASSSDSGSVGSDGSGSGNGPANPGDTGSLTPSPAATQIPPAENPNYDVLDFKATNATPWLAWVIGIINGLMLVGLAILLWRWKKGFWPWAPVLGKMKHGPYSTLPAEVQDVFAQLLAGDMNTLIALEKILKGRQGAQVLQILANLPEEVRLQLLKLKEDEFKTLSSLSDSLRTEGSERNHGL